MYILMMACNVDSQMQLLRAQLSQQASDKDKLVSLLERCQEELDGSVRMIRIALLLWLGFLFIF